MSEKSTDNKAVISSDNSTIRGGLFSARVSAALKTDIDNLQSKLSTEASPINTAKDLLLKLMEIAEAGSVNLQAEAKIQELEEKIKTLEADLEKYSSIEITKLQTDNQELRTENETLLQEKEKIAEEFEEYKSTKDQNDENFDQNHYSLEKSDPRLAKFFSGADARIAAKKKNGYSGKIEIEYEDVINTLVDFASKHTAPAELWK